MAPKKDNQNKKRRRVWLLGLAVALIIIAVLLVFMVFSPPQRYPRPDININDSLASAFTGLIVYNTIKRAENQEETAEITIPPAQVNSILRLARNSYYAYYTVNQDKQPQLPHPESFDAQYNASNFDAAFCWNSGIPWLFGGNIDLHAEFNITASPEIQEEITIKTLRAGWLPLPAAAAQLALPYALAKVREIPEFQAFRKAVKSIETMPDGAIKIVYYPFLLKEYKELFKKNSGHQTRIFSNNNFN